ncbi:hypothetical protein [Shimia sp.]|uniref:hypothetical protein n=1 Tax=Shimia sp. TaxID=1954381 RepID=UPI0035689605
MVDLLHLSLAIAGLVLMLWLFWELFEIVARMARARGRDPLGWVLLALAWSPVTVMLLLWCLGPGPGDDKTGTGA